MSGPNSGWDMRGPQKLHHYYRDLKSPIAVCGTAQTSFGYSKPRDASTCCKRCLRANGGRL